MKANDITIEWLKSIDYQVSFVERDSTIDGVVTRDLTVHLDGRGELTELWSEPWSEFIAPAHVYQSATDFGVVKCWHLHDVHTDQFAITRGKVQVTLVDLREEASSFGHVNVLIRGSLQPGLISIPPGIMHGWKALSHPEIIVLNLQSHAYSAEDEYKFPWNCVLEHVWEPHNG